MTTYKVIGYRSEKYMKRCCKGHNCDFDYYDEEDDMDIICLQSTSGEKYELQLYTSESECPSGWTTASYGCIELNKVSNFGKITNIPKETELEITFSLNNSDSDSDNSDSDSENEDIKTSVFTYSPRGKDRWYPCGYVYVHRGVFRPIDPLSDTDQSSQESAEKVTVAELNGENAPNPREKNRRMVWIFYGDSGAGKSSLSDSLCLQDGMEKYETDSAEELPASIAEPIIVIGNKWNHTLHAVKERISAEDNPEVIQVHFSINALKKN